jgi:hypothetical protein
MLEARSILLAGDDPGDSAVAPDRHEPRQVRVVSRRGAMAELAVSDLIPDLGAASHSWP